MTFRSREEINGEEISASSDAYYFSPGCHLSSTFSPSEFQDWSLSPELSQVPALDSPSECSIDSQEPGSGSYYSPGLLSSVSTMDYSTLSQLPDERSFFLDPAVPVEDHQPMDPAEWRQSVHGSVDQGLLRTESYSCQSSVMSLPYAAESAISSYQLPGPYIQYEPTVHGSMIGASAEVSPYASPGFGYLNGPSQNGPFIGCRASDRFESFPGSLPAHYLTNAQVQYSGSYVVSVPAPPMRPLLPRTEGSDLASQPIYAHQRPLRPQILVPHRPASSSVVSSIAGLPKGFSGDASSPVVTSAFSSHVTTSGSIASMACLADPTEESFASFINLEHEDQVVPESASYRTHKHHSAQESSVTHGYEVLSAEQAICSPISEPSAYKLEPEAFGPVDGKIPKATSNASGSLTGESDEGRHRTHELYSRPPDKDGWFRCPFKDDDSNCQHKQTKLKCNYDKYVDSHLKPFRCKLQECAKQEFSSTACLLRHEREAHGMHGHGNRPHLCHYDGCERALPGSGFPRRYNLFDHMKRVHDHKEDPADSTSRSPTMGGETQKKVRGPKRKASTSPVAGQPAQKTVVLHQQRPALAFPVAQDGIYYPGYY